MIYQHADIEKNIDEACDVCVIGSGAGGAVVAKELAQAGLSVIVLEEGGYFQTQDFRSSDTIQSLLRLYRNGGMSTLYGNPRIRFVEGRCVGGSTTVGGGVCMRTPEKVLKRWQWEHGLVDISPLKMESSFKRVEENLNVSFAIEQAKNEDALLMKKGAERLGYEVDPVSRSAKDCVGTNHCLTGCPTGGKQSALLSYIPEFLKAGGRLYANCRVRQIKWKNSHVSHVIGSIVDPESKKVVHRVKIRASVVVTSCGAMETPALLKRSGLPDRSKMLGQNLLVHPQVRVLGVFDNPVYGWMGVNQSFQVSEFINEGILISTQFLPPGLLAASFPMYGSELLNRIKEAYHHCVMGTALIEDSSAGSVKAMAFDQTGGFYHLNQADFNKALRAMSLMAEIYFAAGAKRVYLPLRSLNSIHTIDDIRKIYHLGLEPGDLELGSIHAMGSARMGYNPLSSVVNSYGESHPIKGLFVADASVLPSSIGVPPQETIMALATRTAFYIAENMSSYTQA